MPFVTDDRRVKWIVGDMGDGKISGARAAELIRELPNYHIDLWGKRTGAEFGYLGWEVSEALAPH